MYYSHFVCFPLLPILSSDSDFSWTEFYYAYCYVFVFSTLARGRGRVEISKNMLTPLNCCDQVRSLWPLLVLYDFNFSSLYIFRSLVWRPLTMYQCIFLVRGLVELLSLWHIPISILNFIFSYSEEGNWNRY